MSDKSCAYRIKIAMDELNLTQAELATAASISASSLSDYLTGKYLPKQDKIFQLAKALKVSPAWLMGYDVSKNQIEEDDYEPHTIAAHKNNPNEDWTEEELKEIEEFKEFVKMKRRSQK